MSAEFIRGRKSNDLALFSSKIFTEKLETDVEIISKSGSKHPCHKIFLVGNSPVFQAMFKGGCFMEGQTNSVTLDMSEKGVVALLYYLYCHNSGDPYIEAEYDFETCMEASELYSITNLQTTIRYVILNKPNHWLQVDSSLQLFCIVRNMENCDILIMRCIQLLESKHAEMTKSEVYKRLFKENPEAGMDLCTQLSK